MPQQEPGAPPLALLRAGWPLAAPLLRWRTWRPSWRLEHGRIRTLPAAAPRAARRRAPAALTGRPWPRRNLLPHLEAPPLLRYLLPPDVASLEPQRQPRAAPGRPCCARAAARYPGAPRAAALAAAAAPRCVSPWPPSWLPPTSRQEPNMRNALRRAGTAVVNFFRRGRGGAPAARNAGGGSSY
jgi:hypothetical protein